MLKVYIEDLDNGKVIVDSKEIPAFIGVMYEEQVGGVRGFHCLDGVDGMRYLHLAAKLADLLDKCYEQLGKNGEIAVEAFRYILPEISEEIKA